MGMRSKKELVMVVDDDTRMLLLMQRILELEGYQVISARSGEVALDLFAKNTPDIVLLLLDIMMPGMNGHAVCQTIREVSQVPIIMVTAKESDEEKVGGLDAGADDYVVKPFSSSELAARVRAVLRRSRLWDERSDPPFRCSDLVIDWQRRSIAVGDQEIRLTATECRLLCYLARNSGRVLTPDQILERVWGEEYVGESHLLQVHIARLRQKLGDAARQPKYIVTRPGIGYTMPK